MPPSTATNVNLVGLAFTLVMGILILLLPRRLAIIPFLLTCCFITLGQRINVGGFNFYMLRIVVLFGWVRVIARGEFWTLERNIVDTCVLIFVAASFVMSTVLWGMNEFFSNLGPVYNALGGYFLVRILVRDMDDVDLVLRALCILMVPLALAMILEKINARNLFSLLGGVPEITMAREGRLRAQGPFAHPILAGTFGATSLPLFIGLWFKMNSRIVATVGIAGALTVIIASASSGPLMACGVAILGLFVWPFRKHMRAVRWICFFSLVSLHMVMKAPIWFLIGRLSFTVGGSGWARSELIDEAIKHFGEWWLMGTTYTRHWTIDNGLIPLPDYPNMVDITSQFILIGVNGGILPLILFIVLIALSFRAVGSAVKQMEAQPFANRFSVWAMGAAVFAYASSFLSVALFDQTIVIWYMLLALISSVSTSSERTLSKKNN